MNSKAAIGYSNKKRNFIVILFVSFMYETAINVSKRE